MSMGCTSCVDGTHVIRRWDSRHVSMGLASRVDGTHVIYRWDARQVSMGRTSYADGTHVIRRWDASLPCLARRPGAADRSRQTRQTVGAAPTPLGPIPGRLSRLKADGRRPPAPPPATHAPHTACYHTERPPHQERQDAGDCWSWATRRDRCGGGGPCM